MMRRRCLGILTGLFLAGCSGSEEVPAPALAKEEVSSKAEQLANLKALQEEAESLKAGPEPPPREPHLTRRTGETDQQLFLRIQQAMRQARKLALNEDPEQALSYYRDCLAALEALPAGFNPEIVARRQVTCREQLEVLAHQLAVQEKKLALETAPEEAAETASSNEMPALMGGMPAPLEGQQALFLQTVKQVQTARRLEEQGRLRPALHEYEEALKKMKKMAPQLQHGDGGPDDDVRDAIRRLKRKLKK